MEGGTTFHFVTDGIEAALRRPGTPHGDAEVRLGGGASTVRQALAAGVVDEIDVSIAPLILGAGARLFQGLDRGTLKPQADPGRRRARRHTHQVRSQLTRFHQAAPFSAQVPVRCLSRGKGRP